MCPKRADFNIKCLLTIFKASHGCDVSDQQQSGVWWSVFERKERSGCLWRTWLVQMESWVISHHWLLTPGFHHTCFAKKEREACGVWYSQGAEPVSTRQVGDSNLGLRGPHPTLFKVTSMSGVCYFSPSLPWTDYHYFWPGQLQELPCWAPHFCFFSLWIIATEWPARSASYRIETLSRSGTKPFIGFPYSWYRITPLLCSPPRPHDWGLPASPGLHSFLHLSTDSCPASHCLSGAPSSSLPHSLSLSGMLFSQWLTELASPSLSRLCKCPLSGALLARSLWK